MFVCLLNKYWMLSRFRMIKTYQKLHKQIAVLDYFVEHKFTFTMENTTKLWHSLSLADQKMFNFNIREINWAEYFRNSLMGVRCFMGKEQPETIPKAKQLMNRYTFYLKN